MDELTKYCSNCKRNVAERNYVLHAAHCQRYMKICTRCEEPIPIKEIEDHLKEYHAQVSCEKCNMSMERWQLESHQPDCTKRLENCQYCSVPTVMDELREHEVYCCSRSEMCRNCKEYVLVKDEKFHYLSCPGLGIEKIPVEPEIKCDHCQLSFKASLYDSHQKLCCGLERFLKFRRTNRSSASSSDESDARGCSSHSMSDLTSRFDNAMQFPSRDDGACLNNSSGSTRIYASVKHEDSVRSFEKERDMVNCIYCDDYFVPQPGCSHTTCGSCAVSFFKTASQTDTVPKKVEVPGSVRLKSRMPELNGSDSRSSVVRTIYTFNKNEASSKNESDSKPDTSAHEKNNDKKNWTSMAKFLESSQHSEEVLAFKPPCLSCDKKFPMDEIDNHFMICPMREEACPMCGDRFKLKDLQDHAVICLEETEKLRSTFKNSGRFSVLQNGMKENNMPEEKLSKKQKRKLAKKRKSEAQTKANEYIVSQGYSKAAGRGIRECLQPVPADPGLPCEFCEKIFPAYELIDHQSGCRPDLLHFPRGESSNASNLSDEGYAMALLPPTPQKAETVRTSKEVSLKGKDTINKQAVMQNVCNEVLENRFHAIAEGRGGEIVKMMQVTPCEREPEYNNARQSSSKDSRPSTMVVNTVVETTSQAPPPIANSVDFQSSLLMRGRGRSRLIQNIVSSSAGVGRPGEFVQTFQRVDRSEHNIVLLSNDHAASQATASQQTMSSSFIDQAFESGAKKQRSICSTTKVASNPYKFEALPTEKSVDEIIKSIAWKTTDSKNLYHESDNVSLDKTGTLEEKISLINSTSGEKKLDVSNDLEGATGESANKGAETGASRPADCHVQGVSFRFTASGEMSRVKKATPFAVRNLRRPLAQKTKSNKQNSLC